jgi:hypothetical protein
MRVESSSTCHILVDVQLGVGIRSAGGLEGDGDEVLRIYVSMRSAKPTVTPYLAENVLEHAGAQRSIFVQALAKNGLATKISVE